MYVKNLESSKKRCDKKQSLQYIALNIKLLSFIELKLVNVLWKWCVIAPAKYILVLLCYCSHNYTTVWYYHFIASKNVRETFKHSMQQNQTLACSTTPATVIFQLVLTLN